MMKKVEKMVWGSGAWGGSPHPSRRGLGFQRGYFHCRQMSTAYRDGGYRDERHQPISRGLRTALSEGAGRSALPVSGGWEFLQGVCCSLPPEARCFCTQAAFCALTRALVTLSISVNDWSAKILFWAHSCFARALLLRHAALSWRRGWLPGFVCFLLLFFFFFLLFSPFQHRWRESTKDAGCAVAL